MTCPPHLAGTASAWSLSRFPERFEVHVWEALPVPGGVASSLRVKDGLVLLNDQVKVRRGATGEDRAGERGAAGSVQQDPCTPLTSAGPARAHMPQAPTPAPPPGLTSPHLQAQPRAAAALWLPAPPGADAHRLWGGRRPVDQPQPQHPHRQVGAGQLPQLPPGPCCLLATAGPARQARRGQRAMLPASQARPATTLPSLTKPACLPAFLPAGCSRRSSASGACCAGSAAWSLCLSSCPSSRWACLLCLPCTHDAPASSAARAQSPPPSPPRAGASSTTTAAGAALVPLL
jgi:hypothetical protein